MILVGRYTNDVQVNMCIRSAVGITTLVFCLIATPIQAQQFYFEDVTTDWFSIDPGPQRSVSAADIDNDGWPDLFTNVNWEGPAYLWHNDAGQRWRVETDVPAKIWPLNGGGAVFGDYDNDGDVDLFVPLGMFCKEAASKNMLWRNDRGVFHDVALAAGLDDELATDNAVWLDANRDGHLDLYTGNLGIACLGGDNVPGVNNRLYLANGDGTFRDATETSGLDYQIGSGEANPGGSNGGMVASDLTGNGWPDLLVTAFENPNRLFYNDQGNFVEHVSAEINDPGQAFGIAVADFDGDADLDLFTGSGGSAGGTAFRSQYLVNLGRGTFVDALESVGLGKMAEVNVVGVGAGDVDNDGDVDLFVAEPHTLYRNDGDGTFTDVTNQSGVTRPIKTSLSLADYNLDGQLDVVAGGVVTGDGIGGIFLNSTVGSGHWLGVELVGVESNRSAIGAQLLAIYGQQRLLQEISGGSGFNQDDLVAHFGLGQQTQLDSLVIRWPSGLTETLTDIAADQRVRIIEGRGEAYPKKASVFLDEVRASSVGESVEVAVRVRPALFEPDATITGVAADLTSLGGPEAVPLVDLGDGSYQLEARFSGAPGADVGEVVVLIDQQTSLGPYWIRLASEVSLDGVSTSVAEQTSTPSFFKLSQNYPNPFNSATTIHFSLPAAAHVDLRVYNVAGQRVATLASGVHDAGSHQLRWHGRDDKGGDMGTGVYFCRLAAGERVQTQRMLLLR